MKRRGWIAILFAPLAWSQGKKAVGGKVFDPQKCPLGHLAIVQRGALAVGVDGKGGAPISALLNPSPSGAVGYDPELRLYFCQECGVLFIRNPTGVLDVR